MLNFKVTAICDDGFEYSVIVSDMLKARNQGRAFLSQGLTLLDEMKGGNIYPPSSIKKVTVNTIEFEGKEDVG